MKIGFIGCGNMASAIISGVLSKNAINEKIKIEFARRLANLWKIYKKEKNSKKLN